MTGLLIRIAVLVGIVIAAWWFLKGVTDDVGYAGGLWSGVHTSVEVSPETTDDWKEFINERDNYSVKYPHEVVSGIPRIDTGGTLSQYGFEKSLSFSSMTRSDTYAQIYRFSGTADEAIEGFDQIAKRYTLISVRDAEIDGREAKIATWSVIYSGRFRTSRTVEVSNYFVEYQPGQTLFIVGPKEFVSTINFR